MKSLASCRVLTFGRSAAADVRIDNLVLDDLARPRFDLHTPWGVVAVQLAVSGEHMAANAAGAIAVAASCGVNLDAAVAAVGQAQLSPWRMEIKRSAAGAIVINDAYNANPESMRAAIETLASLRVSGRRVAVLGVMAELADPAGDHAAIVELLRQRNIELIAVGTDNYGVPAREDAQAVISSLASNDAVLIKGSRVAGLERLAALVV
jgi:UDP-N-acetylmuramoyl-tripeptide--D-alanyl-D-alanine ligase